MDETIFPTEENPESSQQDSKKNFLFMSLDTIFYIFALAFIDQSTVLPAFIGKLTNSTIIIGAITAIRPAGTLLPQLWTAHYLRDRVYHKGFLVKIACVSRIAITLLAGTLFIADGNDKSVILIGFLIMYTAFWVSEGYASVSWLDLVAKCISTRMRGKLLGTTQFAGGLLAIFAGFIISAILSNRFVHLRYPINYAILFTISTIFFALSLFYLSKIKEPPGAPEDHENAFWDYIKNLSLILSENSLLKRFILLQILVGFFMLSLPFYVIYAGKIGGLDNGEVGILLAIQTGGNIIASAIAGYISDRYGPKNVILGTAILMIIAQVIVLSIDKPMISIYGILFFVIGAIIGSTAIGLTNYLLELADSSKRKAYIGLMNTANAPTMLFPIIGGTIIQSSSYISVFIITGIAGVLAFIIALSIQPRKLLH